jgi:penicillin-binding protein 2
MPLNKDLILDNWKGRVKIFRCLVLCLFFIIILRLLHLQVIKETHYATLAQNNYLEIESIQPTRGIVYDRQALILATTRPCFTLLFFPQKFSPLHNPLESYASFLAPILKKTPPEVITILKDNLRYPLKPIYLKKGLSLEEVARLEASAYFFPALKISVTPLRFYPKRSLACHLLGYVNLIKAEQLKLMPEAEPIDFYGQTGVERVFQSMLAGQKGKQHWEVDALGRILRPLKKVSSIPGNNIYLTLDTKLQAYAESLLKDKIGVIVALTPKNGEVLVLASNPGFDPNLFVQGMDKKTWQELKDNPKYPLENRATAGIYPPGSTLKIVTALAALENKIISTETKINCKGEFPFGNRIFRCWKEKGHGLLDLKKAITQSCDVYFYHLGNWLGIKRLTNYAKKCGFGQPTGIEIKEAYGFVPTSSSKWQKGEALNLAIGQGALGVTPLQIAQFFAALANGGSIYKPKIALKIVSPEGKIIEEIESKIKGKLPVSESNLNFIKEAMASVMSHPLGTGYRAKLDHIQIAGKTGTAQVVSLPQKEKSSLYALPKDHAWFAGFAPVDNPKIVVVVLIEHGGSGGSVAAPLASKLIEAYLVEGK